MFLVFLGKVLELFALFHVPKLDGLPLGGVEDERATLADDGLFVVGREGEGVHPSFHFPALPFLARGALANQDFAAVISRYKQGFVPAEYERIDPFLVSAEIFRLRAHGYGSLDGLLFFARALELLPVDGAGVEDDLFFLLGLGFKIPATERVVKAGGVQFLAVLGREELGDGVVVALVRSDRIGPFFHGRSGGQG